MHRRENKRRTTCVKYIYLGRGGTGLSQRVRSSYVRLPGLSRHVSVSRRTQGLSRLLRRHSSSFR